MTALPSSLQLALENLSETVPLFALRSAYQALSDAYHRGENSFFSFTRPEQVLAYLLARLPATYAAVYKTMLALKESLPEWECKSVIDIGAGPGTASWAAAELFPHLEKITLLEKSPEMLLMGQKLAASSAHTALREATWLKQDLSAPFSLPAADLAIFSYVFAETPCLELAKRFYELGSNVLIVEPGTPKGFANILKLRDAFLELGAFIAAPCPHALACPSASWCHFPARVERTKLHKLLKEGSLGYEDEKYSYIAVSHLQPKKPILGRVVDKPLKLSGHVKLSLCTNEGKLELKTISRKQKELYRQARDAEWSSSI